MPKFLFLLLLFLYSSPKAEVSIEHELDPYYSNIGLYVPLTEKDIPTVVLKNEKQIYLSLFKGIFNPRFFLLEASLNPLPVLGTFIKDQQNNFYQDNQINNDLNLIEALTEGFEEPYALSFFVGNVIRFKLSKDDESEAINKGYSGFLLSIGDRHIKQNTLINDNWIEVEWKLKGDRRSGPIYHSWSFRVGAKLHDNPEIADVSYFGIRREFFNKKLTSYKIFQNTGIDFRVDFAKRNSDLIQRELYVEKRWPKAQGVFKFGIGLKQTMGKYSGSLADEAQTRLILRPMFLF